MIGNGTYIGRKGKSGGGSPPSNIIWSDDFESYVAGSELGGQGQWGFYVGLPSLKVQEYNGNKVLELTNYDAYLSLNTGSDFKLSFIIKDIDLVGNVGIDIGSTSNWSNVAGAIEVYSNKIKFLPVGFDVNPESLTPFVAGDKFSIEKNGYSIKFYRNDVIDTSFSEAINGGVSCGNNGEYLFSDSGPTQLLWRGNYIWIYEIGITAGKYLRLDNFTIESV